MIQLHCADCTIAGFSSAIQNPNSAFVESGIQRSACSSGAKFRGGDHDER